jgi:hypothetical protein
MKRVCLRPLTLQEWILLRFVVVEIVVVAAAIIVVRFVSDMFQREYLAKGHADPEVLADALRVQNETMVLLLARAGMSVVLSGLAMVMVLRNADASGPTS